MFDMPVREAPSTARAPVRMTLLACIALAALACSGTTTPTGAPVFTTTPPGTSGGNSATEPAQRPSPIDSIGGAAASSSERPSGTASTRTIATPSETASAGPSVSETPEPSNGSAVSGDVPDNAVFLTYRDAGHGFSIQYVEGWQVVKQADGVLIRDKDSSETVTVVAGQTDANYETKTDLPALQAQPSFELVKRDTVTVGGTRLPHLVYHLPAAPDPVTGKQVPSTVDRYYVPGPRGIAVIALSTPDGVDNLDAFRQMIESFRWQ